MAHARAALAAAAEMGVPVTLESAPGAGGYAGPAWWKALIERALAEYSGGAATAVLDCGEEPGTALAALRAGVKHIRFTGDANLRQRLGMIAAPLGAVIHDTARDEGALDLLDAQNALALARRFLARNEE